MSPTFVQAQIPELQQGFEENVMSLAELEDVHGPAIASSTLPDSIWIELAQLAYGIGDYDKCCTYYLKTTAALKADDKLMLANALQFTGKHDLRNELFQSYLDSRSDDFYRKLSDVRAPLSNLHPGDALKGRVLSAVPLEFGKVGLVKDNKAALASITCSGAPVIEKSLDFPFASSDLGSFTKVSEREYVLSTRDDNGTFSLKYVLLSKNGQLWKKNKTLYRSGSHSNAAFPYYAGGVLYFSSDREGGFGGFDLYKGKLKKGKLRKVQNLGVPFNSISHEVYPVVDGNTLYFSSNGLPGLGSFDMYSASFSDSTILALPAPLNSPNADWLVHSLGENNVYVLRSTYKEMEFMRFTGSAGADVTDQSVQVYGKVCDEDDVALSGIRIYCSAPSSGTGTFCTTNTEGKFEMRVPENGKYLLEISTAGYKPYSQLFQLESTTSKPLLIKLVQQKEIVATTAPQLPYEPEVKDPGKEVEVTPEASPDKNDVREDAKPTEIAAVHPPVTEVPAAPTNSSSGTVNSGGEFNSQSGNYLAVFGAAFNETDARKLLKTLKTSYPNVEMYFFPEKNLYRAGIDLGPSKEEALTKFYQIKKDRDQVWLLRP